MKPNSAFARRILAVGLALGCGWPPVEAAERPAAEPEVSLSLRGVSGATIEVGEPFRVFVRVTVPDERPTTLELAPAQGSWIEATRVEILSAGSGSIRATARPVAVSSERKTILDQEHPATGLWWFPAAAMAPLAPGDYAVRARLVIRDGAGWKGESVSEPVRFRVVATSNNPERVMQRILARAHAAIFEDELAKAAGILDAVLEPDPDNVPILKLRAALCLRGGDLSSAQVCANRARTLDARLGGHPSVLLHELALRIEQAGSDGTVPGKVEAWATPPRSVFNPVRPVAARGSERASNVQAAAVAPKAATTTPSPGSSAPVAKVADVPAGIPAAGVAVLATELNDAKFRSDAAGQWAATATAGSQYGKTQYSPAKATGAPDISVAGNSPDAWCPASKDKGTDWLEVTFAKPVQATEVRVRQNDAAGAIAKVEAIEPDGTAHVWWEGIDPYQRPVVRDFAWFAVRVPKTSYLVATIKLTLNLASGPGWKQVDAVQLVAAP